MYRFLPLFLFLGSCVKRDPPWVGVVGWSASFLTLVTSVVIGIVSECQRDEVEKERYDRICGMLLMLALGLFLVG